MALKVKYDSKDDIPEGLETHYTERDGAFYLNADDYETKEDTRTLKKTLKEERDKRKTLEGRVSAIPDDFDPDEYEELKQLREKDLDEDEIKKQTEKRYEKKLTAKDERIQELERERDQKDAKVRELLIEQELSQALADVDVVPALLNGAKKLHMDNIRLVEEDGDYKAVAGDLEESIDKYISKWASTDEGKSYIKAAENSGGGGGGGSRRRNGGEDNPWKKESFNLTRQGQIMKENPEKAERLKKEAGVT